MTKAATVLIPFLCALQLAAQENVSPQLRESAEGTLDVLILLRQQPQQEALRRVETDHAIRLEAAEAEFQRRASALRTPELVQAMQTLESATLDFRRDAAAESARLVEAVQRPFRSRLAGMGAIDIFGFTAINLVHARIPAAALQAVAEDPETAYVFPNGHLRAKLDQSRIALGTLSLGGRAYVGTGLSVAIIDTGINPQHPTFAGKTVVPQIFFRSATADPCFGEPRPFSQFDVDGHGTHVAGIAAGGGSAACLLCQGVASGTRTIYDLRVFYRTTGTPACGGPGSYSTTWADMLEALQYVAQQTSARVINASLGSNPIADDSITEHVIDRLLDDHRMTMAAAGGNEQNDATVPAGRKVNTPGLAYNAISVAAMDTFDSANRATHTVRPSSSQGPTPGGRNKPDIAAPGGQINSAANDAAGNYVVKGGTSMASPHVAGAAVNLVEMGVADPAAHKALLINSADWKPTSVVGGKGTWVADWGWGYANLNTLTTHLTRTTAGKPVCQDQARDPSKYATVCFTDSISGPPRFYQATAAGPVKATMAWNRRSPSGSPALTLPLAGAVAAPAFNDLDLLMFNPTTNARQDVSLSAAQNVEQVYANSPAPAVLKVVLRPPLRGGLAEERFALASSAALTPVDPPRLTINCTAPPPLTYLQNFAVDCTVRNAAAAPALAVFNVVVAADAPGGGAATVPRLGPGESQTVRVAGVAPPPDVLVPFTISAFASGTFFGESVNASVVIGRGGVDCSRVAFNPGGKAFGPEGGTATFTLANPDACPVNIVPMTFGRVTVMGNSVSVEVDASTATRYGEVAAVGPAGRTVALAVVSQNDPVDPPPPCGYTVPAAASAGYAGGAGSINIGTDTACPSTVSSNQPWLTITSAATANGPRQVQYTVAANTQPNQSTPPRTANITVAGTNFNRAVVLTQAGLACTYTVDDLLLTPPAAGVPQAKPVTVLLTAPSDCRWTASTATAWLHLSTAVSGTGGGALSFWVDPNYGAARRGAIQFADKTINIDQPAAVRTYEVSGKVTDPQGGAVAGVTLTFAGGPAAVATDAGGNWKQSGFTEGQTYTVTPSLAGFTFDPPSRTFSAAATGLTFIARRTFTVTGQIAEARGAGVANVVVTFTTTRAGITPPAPVRTDANGNWTATGFAPGVTYRATPSLGGYDFNPNHREFDRADLRVNFLARPPYAVSGKVVDPDRRPLAGVRIEFISRTGNGQVPRAVVTDATGTYRQTGFAPGTVYLAAVNFPGHAFLPSEHRFANASNALDFREDPPWSARGTVRAQGRGLAGVTIKFTVVSGTAAAPGDVVTGADGTWSQSGFLTGNEYRATPSKSGFRFNPQFRTYRNAAPNVNFEANAVP